MPKKPRASSLFIRLFSLPFLAFGLFMLGWMIKDLSTWYRVQSWVEVPAKILSVNLKTHHDHDGATTYEVLATYSYQFEGEVYHGSRVGITKGADNVGSYQQDLYRHLKNSHSVQAYANPNNPIEALLNRELRYGMMLFRSLFVIMFGGFGCGVWVGPYIVKHWKSRSAQQNTELSRNQPWEGVQRWNREGFRPRYWAVSTIFLNIFGSVWCGISMPLAYKLFIPTPHWPQDVEWLLLLFPLIGLFFLWLMGLKVAQYWAFKSCRLHLNPFPGTLGGEVSGSVSLPRGSKFSLGLDFSLACIEHLKIQRGSKTTYTSRAVWRQDLHNKNSNPSMDGQDYPFSFITPSDCPESTRELGFERIEWQIHVVGRRRGLNCDLKFDIPVFKTHRTQAISVQEALSKNCNSERNVLEAISAQGYTVHQQGENLIINRKLGRHVLVMLPFLLLTICWDAIVVFLFFQSAWFFMTVFGLFGVLITSSLFSTIMNRSKIEINTNQLKFWPTIFSKGTVIDLNDILDLEAKSRMSVGQTKYYTLYAKTNHGNVALMHSIPGDMALGWLKKCIMEYCTD
jgi:hypothetical protein